MGSIVLATRNGKCYSALDSCYTALRPGFQLYCSVRRQLAVKTPDLVPEPTVRWRLAAVRCPQTVDSTLMLPQ